MDYIIDENECQKLSELASASKLKAGDKFLLSRFNFENEVYGIISAIIHDPTQYGGFLRYLAVKAANDPDFSESDAENVLAQIHSASKQISYGGLSVSLGHEISGSFHLSSMAFRDTTEYSTIGHRHGFSKFEIIPKYSAQDENTYKIMSVSSFNTNQLVSKHDIYAPRFDQPVQETYDIGETRFFSASTSVPTSYTAANFSGWVYADGKEYPKSEFPEAYELYKDYPDSTLTSFVVPNLNGFYVPNSTYRTGNPQTTVTWENALPAHKHSGISTKSSTSAIDKMTATLKLPYSTGATLKAGYNNTMHTGYTTWNGNILKPTISLTMTGIKTKASSTDEMPDNQTESYPAYHEIPVMIYIGIPMTRRNT